MKQHYFFKGILLCLCLFTGINTFAHDAYIDGIYYNFSGDEAEVTNRSQYSNSYFGSVVIPASVTYGGKTYGVTSIDSWAFSDCTGLTSITISNSVTSIGNNAFQNCIGLTSITIPNSVTNIDYLAFSGCNGLTSITIPSSVTSIGISAFSACSNLTSVHITDLAAWCNISFYSYDANPLAFAHHLYLNGQEIQDLVIPEGVTSIGEYAFEDCTSLTSVTIPAGVTSIGEFAFADCSSLTSVTIPNSVTTIGNYAFQNCTGLTSTTIPNSVTSIGARAFNWCSSLKSVILGNSVTSIGEEAFYGCSNLTSVHITDLAAWCNIIFYGEYSNPLDCAHHLYLNGQEIKDLVIPDSVINIRSYAFSYCSGLTSVIIPESVTSIGDNAFRGCSSLTSITIPNSVTSIGNFAFRNCSALTSITIPNSVTSIGREAFSGCSSLTSVTIPESVTSIGSYAFIGCTSLTSITIPNSVTSIGDGAFERCTGLTSITIPNSVTSIGYWAFENCSSLTSVTIGNSVTSIGVSAFFGCTSLTSITIPNSVTSISYYAFQGCSALTSVIIGSGVKYIESKAFADCQELANVYCYAENVPTKNRNTNYPSTDIFENSYIQYATLHVPAASIEKYKTTAPWSGFGSIVSINGDDPGPNIEPEPEKCATPTISYNNGELTFNCETEGVEFVSEITDSDIKKNFTAKIQLSVTYNITVYATKAEYENSDTIQATLCWIDQQPATENITDEDAVAEVKAMPVLIQTQGSTITIQGAAEGTPIAIYGIDGKKYGSAIAEKDSTTISTTLQSGSVAVVKIGEKAVKVLVK